ncbi:hypothetical protein KCP74_02100 [Salmonella enterica subsp. enterica]|nr:hypothetical protein KCP74_02100 [Salmonella enterica subsp. enterica]
MADAVAVRANQHIINTLWRGLGRDFPDYVVVVDTVNGGLRRALPEQVG